jgi:hypothetical protein
VKKRGFGAACLGTRVHGGCKEAWSFILCVVVYLLGGGRNLAGTSWRGANQDLIGGELREHTKDKWCERVSHSAKGRPRAQLSSSMDKEGKDTLLGCILQGTCLQSLRGACKVYRFLCVIFLVFYV